MSNVEREEITDGVPKSKMAGRIVAIPELLVTPEPLTYSAPVMPGAIRDAANPATHPPGIIEDIQRQPAGLETGDHADALL
jgi:hypothetical protein